MGSVAVVTDFMPAIREAFKDSSPLHLMFIETLNGLGGMDFLEQWAEDNPTEYINILLRLAPLPVANPQQQGTSAPVYNLNLHSSLAPGPLDGTPVSEQ